MSMITAMKRSLSKALMEAADNAEAVQILHLQLSPTSPPDALGDSDEDLALWRKFNQDCVDPGWTLGIYISTS